MYKTSYISSFWAYIELGESAELVDHSTFTIVTI